jgi:hypothetical protein
LIQAIDPILAGVQPPYFPKHLLVPGSRQSIPELVIRGYDNPIVTVRGIQEVPVFFDNGTVVGRQSFQEDGRYGRAVLWHFPPGHHGDFPFS